MSAPAPRPSRAAAWWLALRPKTLSVAASPVLAGASLAWQEPRQFFLLPFLVTLICSLLIQAATNLYNDAADFERGADTPDRLGPPRASASGWLAPRDVKRVALACFAVAFIAGQYLVWHGGWGILALGVACIAAGILYTGGPRPIAYGAGGELFVWLFFGLAATLGSYYLQAFTLSWSAFLAANALGLLAAAVIVVNNTRDLETAAGLTGGVLLPGTPDVDGLTGEVRQLAARQRVARWPHDRHEPARLRCRGRRAHGDRCRRNACLSRLWKWCTPVSMSAEKRPRS